MANINTLFSSFLLGEVSPRLFGRTEMDQYMQSLKTQLNNYTVAQGGAQMRPGSQMIEYTTNELLLESDGVTKVGPVTPLGSIAGRKFREIPFQTSTGKNFIIIANTGLLKTWSVLDTQTYTLYQLDQDVAGASFNFTNIDVQNLDYTGIDLSELQIDQQGDYISIAHKDRPPLAIRLELTEHFDVTPANNFYLPKAFAFSTVFTVVNDTENQQKTPYLEANVNNIYGAGEITYPAAAYAIGAVLTISTSGAFGTFRFKSGHIGAYFKFTNLNGTPQTGAVIVTAVAANGLSATAHVTTGTLIGGSYLPPGGAGNGYGITAGCLFEESAWSNHRGWPAAVAFFQSRLFYGGTYFNPNRIWGSQTGDIDGLQEIPYVQDAGYATYASDVSRAYSFDVSGGTQIFWLSAGKRLAIGTKSKEHTAFGPTGAIGPGVNTSIEAATSFGSSYRPPLRINSEVIFVQRSKQRLRNLIFNFQEDDYKSQDLSKLAEHIVRDSQKTVPDLARAIPEFNNIVVQTSPDTRIWTTDSNGGLSSCTIERDSGVLAWARHRLAGAGNSNYGTQAFVRSICALPSYDSTFDEIWMIVDRNINGFNTVTIEKIGGYFNEQSYLSPNFSPLNGFPEYLRTRAVFVDCAHGRYPITPDSVFTFDTLKNTLVSVLADGKYIGEYTVSNAGTLTLPQAYTEVIVGFKYTPEIETVDLEVPGSPQSNQAKFKASPEVFVRFNRTSNCRIQRSGQTDWQRIQFVEDGAASDEAVPLYTGDKRAHTGGVGRNLNIRLQQDQPLPWEVVGVIVKGSIND